MDWIDIGLGAGVGEIVRATQLPHGVLMAVVYQRRGYKSNPDFSEREVVIDEVTRALSFVVAATLEDLVPHCAESDSASDTESETVSPDPAPAASGAT